MIAADKNGRKRGNFLSRKILPEKAHASVFRGDTQAFQVIRIPNCLEIAAADEEVDLGVLELL